MLAYAHVLTAQWHQFSFEIRNEPTRQSQSLCRVLDHLVLTNEQEHGHVQYAQFVIREHTGHGPRNLGRKSNMLPTEINQVECAPHTRVTGSIFESHPSKV